MQAVPVVLATVLTTSLCPVTDDHASPSIFDAPQPVPIHGSRPLPCAVGMLTVYSTCELPSLHTSCFLPVETSLLPAAMGGRRSVHLLVSNPRCIGGQCKQNAEGNESDSFSSPSLAAEWMFSRLPRMPTCNTIHACHIPTACITLRYLCRTCSPYRLHRLVNTYAMHPHALGLGRNVH